jgi:ketosteroid isomerase-like protein
MKRIAFAISVAVLVFAVTIIAQTPAQTKSGSAEQELLKLEQDWANAVVKADLAFLDRILAEDWVFTDPEGVVWTKAQSQAALKSGEEVITSMVPDDMKARVYGDAAVVTGRNTTKETFKGKDVSGLYRWTDTWIKKAGRWQCVATHVSMIAQK